MCQQKLGYDNLNAWPIKVAQSTGFYFLFEWISEFFNQLFVKAYIQNQYGKEMFTTFFFFNFGFQY